MQVIEKKSEIRLSPAQILAVRLYRTGKQILKRIEERVEARKASILGFSADDFVGMEGDKKVVSVSTQDRTGIDFSALEKAEPELAERIRATYGKTTVSRVVRLH